MFCLVEIRFRMSNLRNVRLRNRDVFEAHARDGEEAMQSLSIYSNNFAISAQPRSRFRFWKRQFALERTRVQVGFDICFGILLPVICFTFDPIVFRTEGIRGRGILHGIQAFAYVLSTVEIFTLAVFLAVGPAMQRNMQRLAGFFSGTFTFGALFSLSVGLLILPFSLIGLFFVIGILGFVPFFTFVVYLRNAVRADALATICLRKADNAAMFFLGFLSIIIVASALQRLAGH